MIEENIKQVEDNIVKACERANRDRSEVTLICVSKTKPASMVEEAYKTGQRNFGENKVQEINDKYPILPDDIKWHLIGHLQRNKVKYIINKVHLIHSVDSIRLAEQIQHEAEKADKVMNILVQVNVANEDTKFGLQVSETEDVVREIAKMPNVHICGLMTIAPFTDDPETNRVFFRKLKQLSVDIKSKNIDNVSMDCLSMGMTGDYQVAIEEGATLVRVGTGIFGERIYNK
ncbi:YggS family pyridoxal phosphate-dependent enzyme [Lachnospiraceae bacterium HCP1S3_C3]|nr:YggS family pyridoxal phosphate-dependent enzyme [Lachnospiraceae bacterium]MDD6857240.1 YggS family pyridoxal phosphate-dependent enzyme [Lachnospiraceae bacterium]